MIRLFVAALATTAVGCGSELDTAWETTPKQTQPQTEESESERAKLVEEGDAAWEKRDDPGMVEKAVQKWEAANELSREYETGVKIARGHYFLADCHLRFDEDDKGMETRFDEGRKAAERALSALSPQFAERMEAGARLDEALDVLDKEAVPALYWRSSALGKWAGNKGFATLLSYKDEVRATMEFCLEKDGDFYYGGPHRYFGAYYARIPAMAGRDLDRSKEHFEKSIESEPDYFATRVLYAQDYAINAQERAVFDEQLEHVLNNDPTVLPDVAPENRCEVKKAEELKAKADEVFEE
ncbi:MAG: TRAP transporter TatT component family protein [Polyangiales bacterium]